VGDHPPITPMRASTEDQVGGGEAWRLYDFIARHFIASVSPDCEYETQTARFDANGESFSAQGVRVITHGWTEIMPRRMIKDCPLPTCVVPGANVEMKSVRLRSEMTAPPGYLTESELIGIMEKNGIGTDASIPTHINNIQVRKYVDIEKGRRMVPTQLGITLVQGYYAIDAELVLPTVRRHVEQQLDLWRRVKRRTRAWSVTRLHKCLTSSTFSQQTSRRWMLYLKHPFRTRPRSRRLTQSVDGV